MSINSSWFESTRQSLEQLEVLDKAIVQELFEKQKEPYNSVIIDWKVKNLIDMKQSKCLDALINLTNSDGQKKHELDILSGNKALQQGKTPDVWVNFYDKLKEIKDYNKKNIGQVQINNNPEVIREQVFNPPNKAPEFSGEESKGKYVDMNTNFHEYINLKFIEQKDKYDYLEYLKTFDQFYSIDQIEKEKESKKYKKYLDNLVNYLKDFFQRSQPLTDISQAEQQNKELFEKDWAQNNIKGWNLADDREQMTEEELESNPLYCKYCKKLFMNENTNFNHLDGKKHKRAEKLYAKQQQEGQSETKIINRDQQEIQQLKEKRHQLAYLESQAIRYKELLLDIINDTINNVRKKQTQTSDMMDIDQFEKEDEKLIEESDDEEPVYNPKNLPLGWDGKPIPYWLYKLHGLGIEYKCEICGNYSYWGRRAFERHFSEWRHSYGMKCLKIPNTIHFKEITSINDALALHQKLVMESEQTKFKADVDEEFEDTEGNIMNKKTHFDLKRQGLL